MAQWDFAMLSREDEWVWGWDSTPGIVSVWADLQGRATVWRRLPRTAELVREETRFRPWLVLDRLDDLHHLGGRLGPEGCEKAPITYRELDGPGSLRFLVSAGTSGRTLWSVGDRIRVYRKKNGVCGLLEESDDGHVDVNNLDHRDYDVDHYARQLRQTYAARFACAFTPADYEAVFADPDQMSLFMPAVATIRTVLETKAEGVG